MKRRAYGMLALLTLASLGAATTAEAFLRLENTAFGTGVYLDTSGFRDALPVIQDGIGISDQIKAVERGTMHGRAFAVPFSLGVFADNVGSIPRLPDGTPTTGSTDVSAGAAAGAGLSVTGNLFAVGGVVPGSFEVKGTFEGIETVLGFPGHPNSFRNDVDLELDIFYFYGRPLAFLFIIVRAEVDPMTNLLTGRTFMHFLGESYFYKADGTRDHVDRFGQCSSFHPETCLPWTGSYTVPFNVPVPYNSFGEQLAQGITASLFVNVDAATGFPGRADFIGTATLELTPPDGITVTLGSGQTFGSAPPPPSDATPPATIASRAPGANANGWNNTDVVVSLDAADETGGSGVKEIAYSLSGAQGGRGVVTGSTAGVTIVAEGTTTLTYFARDNAGNQESPKTLTVRIDKTPPTLTCAVDRSQLWPPNHKLVPVTASVSARDALSGGGDFTLVSVAANEGDAAADIQGFAPGTPSLTGQLRAERSGAGSGRVYTLLYRGQDAAGNSATCTASVTVPHDQQ